LVGVLLFSSMCIVTGLLWDISWHLTIGRDTLWSPPHVLEQIGAGLAGIACGFHVLRTTFVGPAAARARSVRFWGFRAPPGSRSGAPSR
jgi:predicted acyltransferase